MLRRALPLLLTVILAEPVHAQDTPLSRLDTADQSRGWEAVGRLDMSGRGFCTGSLIEEDLVLTAAHCLFDKSSGERVDTSQIKFRAGWRNGRAEAYRGVRRAVVHPDYEFQGAGGEQRVRNDLALLQLDHPIRTTAVRPFGTVSNVPQDEPVGVVSYALNREDAPSFQEYCSIIGEKKGVLVTSCSVDFGSSGAPIFRFVRGEARIVSIVSAKAELLGRPVALGTELGAGLAVLRTVMARGNGPFVTSRVPASDSNGRDIGAKFVRP